MGSLRPTVRFLWLFGVFLFLVVLLPIPSLYAQTCGTAGNDCSADPECDDGNPCNGIETCGTCGGGGLDDFSTPCCVCGTVPNDNTVACSPDPDGLFCTGTGLCVAGACTGQTGDPCSGTQCNTCNETADNCFDPNTTPCTDADGNSCTTGECNGQGLCVGQNNTDPCDDNLNCTEPDVCSGGVCTGTPITPQDCTDGINCTIDACVEATGECASDPGQCECQTDADCNDDNVCTDEFCDLATLTCVRTDNTDPCDDGLFCNGPDTCSGGSCSQHDGDPCTGGTECNQICNETGDNCFDPSGTACEDGDVGTVNQCNGQGSCTTTGIFMLEGSGLLSCSLHRGENVRFEASLAWAISGGLGLALAGLLRTLSLRRSTRRR